MSSARMLALLLAALVWPTAAAQAQVVPEDLGPAPASKVAEERNQQLRALRNSPRFNLSSSAGDRLAGPDPGYRIGPDDLLEISVFEAPELNRTIRVSSVGEFSLPPLGEVRAEGLSPRELEVVLQELLRRSFLNDPHVGVFVREMKSHPVSVFGAVRAPGVYQISGVRSLVEILSMAGGLADDAGDTVVVIRAKYANPGDGPAPGQSEVADQESPETPETPEWMLSEHMETGPGSDGESSVSDAESSDPVQDGRKVTRDAGIAVDLKQLLESADPRSNIGIYPGDIVKVARAGIIYVVGEVKRSGGFMLRSNEKISLLQAIAMAEGLTVTAAKNKAVIIRRDGSGGREEIPIRLGKLLKGKGVDPMLEENDIVFVPNNTGKAVLLKGIEEIVRTVSGFLIFSAR